MTQRFKTVGLGPYRKHCLNFKTVDNCTISLNKKNEPVMTTCTFFNTVWGGGIHMRLGFQLSTDQSSRGEVVPVYWGKG